MTCLIIYTIGSGVMCFETERSPALHKALGSEQYFSNSCKYRTLDGKDPERIRVHVALLNVHMMTIYSEFENIGKMVLRSSESTLVT